MDLLLASTSPIRKTLLAGAGVTFRVAAPEVDEAKVKQTHRGPDAELATALAEAKALRVSEGEPNALVVGSDSLISVAGQRFDKPADREQAVEHLRFFSDRSMALTSAVALARGGHVEWSEVQRAELHVRPLSDEFIEAYLQAEWPEVGYCVGVFRLEGRGVQLFHRIAGDHFTILGLPLLPLLGELRRRGIMAA